jgi:hypothetical protein
MSKRKCKIDPKETRTGKPCGASPLKPETEVEGVKVSGDFCRGHDPDIPDNARFGSHAQAKAAGEQGGRPRLPTPTDIARRLIEANELVLLRPYYLALGYDVKLGPDGPELKSIPGGGVKVHGESKEGHIVVSDHLDLGAMQEAAERLWNRVYGKPKQSTEITGPGGGPIEHEHASVPTDQEFHADVAKVLAEAEAVKADAARTGG